MSAFAIGQRVEVKMGARWVPGEVTGVRPSRRVEEDERVDVDLEDMRLHSVHPSSLRPAELPQKGDS